MRVAFRVDASLEIGVGHVMRCLTLAHGLGEQGAHCIFICREHRGNLLETIRLKNIEAYGIPLSRDDERRNNAAFSPPHISWLGSDWATDAQQTLALLKDNPVDWLVLDHYALDARWERTMRPAYQRLMVIDDLADRPHDCDLLLDQNLGRHSIDYADFLPPGRQLLIGPQYALLRPEFAALRPYSLNRRAKPQLKRLLVSMGGVDNNNTTGLVLAALKQSSLSRDCHITVVMGHNAPWLEHVINLAVSMPWSTEVRVDVNNMAELMAASDWAIGAAGTTALERCCLGLPTLVLVLADNQLNGALALASSGCICLLEDSENILSILPRQMELLQDCDTLLSMQHACSAITDGAGLIRIVTTMRNFHG
jgi:UDP-2,4-diacetamido-2,4,6-trideoxy-beta-L-altropyranose hydrolase